MNTGSRCSGTFELFTLETGLSRSDTEVALVFCLELTNNRFIMADNKILQAILDGVNRISEDLKGFKSEVYKRFDVVDGRIDKLGMQIAHLEDDAPTVAEFDRLEKRVDKLGKRFASS